MAQLLVRDVAPEVVENLKKRALRNRRSLEAELRIVLQEAAEVPVVSMQQEVERVRTLFAGRSFSDSATLLREDRER